MQGSILKQLKKLPTLNSQLSDYLKSIQKISFQGFNVEILKSMLSLLMGTTCQTRNLLHYRHLQQRSQSQKCLLLVQDFISKIIKQHPQLLDNVINDFLTHIIQHPSCYISLASLFMIIRSSSPNLQIDRLRKIMHKIVSCFQQSGQMKFLKEIAKQDNIKFENARRNLQLYLSERFKPQKITQNMQDSHISLSKIPPLILPSNKSINSSRYSAISKEQRTRGLRGLHELASMIGQGFIAVQLGCLLAHKRTQQVQQFSQNSDYRNKCLQQIETERIMSSRLSMSQGLSNQGRTSIDKQMDQTNKRYYKKVLIVLINIVNLMFDADSSQYQNMPLAHFILDLIDLCEVGLVELFSSNKQQQDNNQYFSLIKIQMKSISQIFTAWCQRVSFLTQKKHLKLLWNRNKKNSPYIYQQERVQKNVQDDILLKQLKITRIQHLKQINDGAKSPTSEKNDSDFIIAQLVKRFYKLFGLCDMNNSRFYKYQSNLLGILANYLQHSFSSTIIYLSIDTFFPILILIKRQILQLSYPYLDKINYQEPSIGNRKFNKKQKNSKQPLIVAYPLLFCNFLVVISELMSNQRYVEKLLSTIFIKCNVFMQTLEKYTRFLFQNDRHQQIKKVLYFYRKCLETYSQRKLRNAQSKSIKTLFSHLTAYFYPKVGCLALKLQQKQHLISCSPYLNQSNLQQHLFLHDLLQFIKDIFYYCQDQLAQTLLEQQIASFYIKFSLINFIKLYSFLTVSQLVSLQSQNYEPTTKQSPHISKLPQINTTYMIDLIKILTNISINRTYDISRKIKQYRILEFFVREFQLEFQVSENIEKYINKVSKSKEVIKKKEPTNNISKKNSKIPALNLKFQKTKTVKTVQDVNQGQNKSKKNNIVPCLKLPIRQTSQSKQKTQLDCLLQKINDKPKKVNEQFNLNLTKLNLQREPSNITDKQSQRNLIYSSQRRIRKIYSNKILHSESILLVLSLLLNKGLLDSQYCDQFPITHGKVNVLYILHHHLNQESNKSVIPILAESVGKIKPYLCGQRLLKLLSTSFTDLSHYCNWKKISSGAYGVIYSCQTKIEEPRQIAIKEMNFPRSIYQRCVLHDIFTQISCLQNFRLDQRITTMYNYGVVENSYVIVMKRYDCSLRDWILANKQRLSNKLNILLKIFWDVLQIILLLHEKSVIHYDIKADNILLEVPEGQQNPKKVVLGDFGQCKIFQQSKQEIDMKSRGTQCIKSPQMLTLALHLKKQADNYDRRKKAGTTRATDIWSLGCLFYQLLTGQYLFHRADWVNFYVQVTSPNQQILNKQTIQKLQKFHNMQSLIQFLRICLIRDPHHRPEIKSVIQKFKDLFGDMNESKMMIKSPLIVQKDLENLVTKYIEQIKKDRQNAAEQKQSFQIFNKPKENKIRGVRFNNSISNSKNNKFMRIMEDILYCQNINLNQGGYQKMKELKISHIVTTSNHPLLLRFNTLIINFQDINVANLAFRLAPKISDLLREVLLLKGRLLFINDKTNYATNLLIYTLSYWFRCSVYETWCLINTQILLFPTFTSDLLSLSSALKILNYIQQKVQELPKLQCICGTITFILKDLNRNKKRNDLNCKCKKKKMGQYSNVANGPECVTTGCQNYLEFVKKRYCISWESIRWASILPSSLLTTAFPSKNQNNEELKTQILLNSSSPHTNLIEIGSCIKGCKVYSCRICEMMMMATTESKDQILLVMNNMLRRIRQGIMIPNAQQSFAKRTPALSYFTLTKLHMTQISQQ